MLKKLFLGSQDPLNKFHGEKNCFGFQSKGLSIVDSKKIGLQSKQIVEILVKNSQCMNLTLTYQFSID